MKKMSEVLIMSDNVNKFYLSESDRLLIDRYQVDGIGAGICISVMLHSVFYNPSWPVILLAFFVFCWSLYSSYKKMKYFDTITVDQVK